LLISFYIVPVLHAQKNRKKEKILQKESKKKSLGSKPLYLFVCVFFFSSILCPLSKDLRIQIEQKKRKKFKLLVVYYSYAVYVGVCRFFFTFVVFSWKPKKKTIARRS